MKKTRMTALLVAILMTLTLVLTACAPKETGTDPVKTDAAAGTNAPESAQNSAFAKANEELEKALAPLPEKGTGVKLASIESTLANSFWIVMKEGYEDAAAEYGVTIDVLATETEDDIEGQLDIMNNLLVKDYAGIAVSPLTRQNLIPGVVQANQDEVVVVAVGNGFDDDALAQAQGHLSAYVTSDFKAQGELGAQFIVDKMGKGKVAIIEGIPGATQSDARRDGAKEVFEANGMEVVSIQTANFDAQQAYDATIAIVEANPDIVGISCGNDVMALGAVNALKEKDMKDNVAVVGVDFTEEGRAAIKAGDLDASVAMSPYLFGKGGVITLLKAIQGHEMSETVVWTPLSLVTLENVDEMEGWK